MRILVLLLPLAACFPPSTTNPDSGTPSPSPNQWNGHIFQMVHNATGPSAVALQGPTMVIFKPEIGSPEQSTWESDVPSSTYDATLSDSPVTGSGHFELNRTEDTLTFQLSAQMTSSAASTARMYAGSDWFEVCVRKPGAKSFTATFTCDQVNLAHTGEGVAGMVGSSEDGSSDAKGLCLAASTPSEELALTHPDGTTISETTDADGYTCFEKLAAQIIVGAPGGGTSAAYSASGSGRIAIKFTPQM